MEISASPRVAVLTADGLLRAVRRSGVADALELERVRAKLRDRSHPRDPYRLAARLVRDGILTEYQARCCLHGLAGRLAIGRYVILDPLGRGSMGRVYRARHRLLDRVVALKVIETSRLMQAEVVARFFREMRLLGRLDHPHVVRALDADRIGNVPFIVLEYVAGQDLGRVLAARGPLPPGEAAGFGVQAASGLAHAHAHGVVHRDVKLSNLLLGEDGRVRILDLGLGALMDAGGDEPGEFATTAGVVVGTIEYISPEQAAGLPVDGRGDLYSLGCVLYHLLAGEVPFPGGSKVERLARRIRGRPAPLADLRPDLPAGLVEVLDRVMANRPEDRHRDGLEFAEALRPYAATKDRPGPAPSAAPPPPDAAVSDPTALSPALRPIRRAFLAAAAFARAAFGPGPRSTATPR